QDTLELKIGLFDEFSASLKSLRSVVSPLKLESVFKAKAAEFTALGGVDASSIVTATVDASAAIARHEIDVTQKAVAETRFSTQISTTMEEAGLDQTRTFQINVGGRRADIEVLKTDSLQDIADKINTAIDATIDPSTGEAYGEGLGITATVIDNRLILKSSNTGLGTTKTDWDVTRGAGTTDKLGFTVAKGAPSNGTLVISDGTNTYTEGTDFTVTSGSDVIDWSMGGIEPAAGVTYTVSYTVNSNAFSLTGEPEVLTLLDLDDSTIGDPDYNLQAQDAIFKIDGLSITRSSNQVDDLLEGVKLTINGPGTVIMDITQDAEQAVTGVQDFVTAYNDALDWINIRLSESTQEDADDDFSKKFGLLHGNSMLWQSKSQLRMLMTSSVTAKYSTKTGSTVLGTMASRGLSSNSTFELTVGVRTAQIEVTPSDTLSTIASKINTSYEMLHDEQGRTYPIPMASAKVVNNQLVIEASPGRKFSLSASDDVLDTLGLGTPFTLLSQLGISTESADYGKSGKLEFDTDKFMEALREDPEGVAAIMNTMMTSMDDYIGNMVDTSQVQVGDTTAPKGRIASQIYTFRSEITTLDKRISDLERRLEVRARGLYESFANAEVHLAKLQQQASWLSSTLSQLTGGSGN
ncbi:MAG TPA: flagellar filament capping protein FliD, partial [Synergistales bacterium]|nr:flagellar filament capping protein FliD [Synergistales bacterium]